MQGGAGGGGRLGRVCREKRQWRRLGPGSRAARRRRGQSRDQHPCARAWPAPLGGVCGQPLPGPRASVHSALKRGGGGGGRKEKLLSPSRTLTRWHAYSQIPWTGQRALWPCRRRSWGRERGAGLPPQHRGEDGDPLGQPQPPSTSCLPRASLGYPPSTPEGGGQASRPGDALMGRWGGLHPSGKELTPTRKVLVP